MPSGHSLFWVDHTLQSQMTNSSCNIQKWMWLLRGKANKQFLLSPAYVSGQGSLKDIAGITFSSNGAYLAVPSRPRIQNLDELPYPAYHYFPLIKYRIFKKIGVPMLTSRGCGSGCSFCLVPQIAGDTFRARTPKALLMN